MDHEFIVNGKSHKISLEQKDRKVIATLDGRRLELDVQNVSPHAVSLLANGKCHLAHVARRGNEILVAIGNHQFRLEEPDEDVTLSRLQPTGSEKTDGMIKAPMPGLVIKVNVTEGSRVDAGDGLVVVEAMKMEHEMRAAFPATVEKVHVKAGQQVDAFQPLIELKPADEK